MKQEILEKFFISQTGLQDCVSFEEFCQFFKEAQTGTKRGRPKGKQKSKAKAIPRKKTKTTTQKNKKDDASDAETDEEELELERLLKPVYQTLLEEDSRRWRATRKMIEELPTNMYNEDSENEDDVLEKLVDALSQVFEERSELLQEGTTDMLTESVTMINRLDDLTAAMLLADKRVESGSRPSTAGSGYLLEGLGISEEEQRRIDKAIKNTTELNKDLEYVTGPIKKKQRKS